MEITLKQVVDKIDRLVTKKRFWFWDVHSIEKEHTHGLIVYFIDKIRVTLYGIENEPPLYYNIFILEDSVCSGFVEKPDLIQIDRLEGIYQKKGVKKETQATQYFNS